MRKYRNKPTIIDGVRFDSKKEAARYQELKLLEKAGEIKGLCHHTAWEINIKGIHICDYESDFNYLKTSPLRIIRFGELETPYSEFTERQFKDRGIEFTIEPGPEIVVEDVKSPATRKLPLYRLKKKLMLACHGIYIKEV